MLGWTPLREVGRTDFFEEIRIISSFCNARNQQQMQCLNLSPLLAIQFQYSQEFSAAIEEIRCSLKESGQLHLIALHG